MLLLLLLLLLLRRDVLFGAVERAIAWESCEGS
jgi:hypothetical protein